MRWWFSSLFILFVLYGDLCFSCLFCYIPVVYSLAFCIARLTKLSQYIMPCVMIQSRWNLERTILLSFLWFSSIFYNKVSNFPFWFPTGKWNTLQSFFTLLLLLLFLISIHLLFHTASNKKKSTNYSLKWASCGVKRFIYSSEYRSDTKNSSSR